MRLEETQAVINELDHNQPYHSRVINRASSRLMKNTPFSAHVFLTDLMH